MTVARPAAEVLSEHATLELECVGRLDLRRRRDAEGH